MHKGGFTLKELAELTHARMVGDPNHTILGVNTLEEASQDEASFFANPRYEEAMKKSSAGIICIGENTTTIPGKNFLISSNPSVTFQQIALLIFSPEKTSSAFKGIHPTAQIHPSVSLGSDVNIGPYVVIDQGVKIGARTSLAPFTYIGPYSTIGEDCQIHSSVSIRERTLIGNRVILQPGTVIGSCGFGYTTTPEGKHVKLEQLGNVVIEDDVEIGANTTIDRARFKSTKIGRGSKIDNLVQIAHNVEVGPYNLIVSQTGIAGSAKTGKYVILGGQSGVAGHVAVGDFSMVASKAGVSKNLPPKGKYRGIPAIPIDEYNRQEVHVRRLSKYAKEMEELKQKVADLENSIKNLV